MYFTQMYAVILKGKEMFVCSLLVILVITERSSIMLSSFQVCSESTCFLSSKSNGKAFTMLCYCGMFPWSQRCKCFCHEIPRWFHQMCTRKRCEWIIYNWFLISFLWLLFCLCNPEYYMKCNSLRKMKKKPHFLYLYPVKPPYSDML